MLGKFLKQWSQHVVVKIGNTMESHKEQYLDHYLFLLHINDLLKLVSSHDRLFVDDCLIYKTIKLVQGQIKL